MSTTSDPLVDSLTERFDGALRTVAIGDLEAHNYEVRYERHDAECRPEVVNDLLLESLYTDGEESLYGAGDLRAVVRLFDDALVVATFAPEGYGGTFAAFDTDAGVDPTEVVEVCRRHDRRKATKFD